MRDAKSHSKRAAVARASHPGPATTIASNPAMTIQAIALAKLRVLVFRARAIGNRICRFARRLTWNNRMSAMGRKQTFSERREHGRRLAPTAARRTRRVLSATICCRTRMEVELVRKIYLEGARERDTWIPNPSI
jgi:hypothetical protein